MLALFFAFLFNASAVEIRVPVKGMVCGFCSQGIIKKFKAEQAVGKVDVNLDRELVTVVLKDGHTISDERVRELLDDAGFTPGVVERVQSERIQ